MGRYLEAKTITPDTRRAVLERQHNKSISGRYLTEGTASFHHYVERSSSGVGYEWNIVALTFEEHRAVHDHQPIKVGKRVLYTYDQFITLIRNHLVINYEGWSENCCKFHKGWEIEDYGVIRRTRP